jgi:hypothetical protein
MTVDNVNKALPAGPKYAAIFTVGGLFYALLELLARAVRTGHDRRRRHMRRISVFDCC